MKRKNRRYNDIATVTSLDEAKTHFENNPDVPVICKDGDRESECTSLADAEAFYGA